jgi:hypothetical protein
MLSLSIFYVAYPLFIAIDIFWPLYIIRLRDEHVLAIMD